MTAPTLARIRRHPHLLASDLAPLLGCKPRGIEAARAADKPRRWSTWTPAEDAVVLTGGICLRSWAEVAAEIGRTPAACARRRHLLRIGRVYRPRVSAWTEAQDHIALTVRPYILAAEMLGRTETAVRVRVKKLRRASR